MNKLFTEKTEKKGVVTRRLFNARQLFETLKKVGVEFELSFEQYSFREICVKGAQFLGNDEFARLLDKSAKPMFADNKLWKFLHKKFGMDLRIPFVTGLWTTKAIKANLVVNTGHKAYADRIGGTNAQGAITAIAIGTGTTAAAATDTALQTEITTNGGARGAATVSNTTTSTTGDTEQWQKTFTFTGSFAVTEEGLLDNNTSGGILLSHQVFSAVNVASGDTLQITHKIQS